MKTFRTLSVAAVAIALAGPAFAASAEEITFYDQPQHQDGFFLLDRGGSLPDVSVTGSIGAPAPAFQAPSSAQTPFWSAHEAIRLQAEDHN